MGLKSHETPLDRMSDLVMVHNNHALELARKIAQFREADLNKLGASYALVDDDRRGRILDVVRALPA